LAEIITIFFTPLVFAPSRLGVPVGLLPYRLVCKIEYGVATRQ